LASFKISDNPATYIMDSPGVMLPKMESSEGEVGLRLALTGAIKDHLVGEDLIADYLYFVFNNRQSGRTLLKRFDLDTMPSNSLALLEVVARKIGAKRGADDYDHLVAARHLIALFRKGELGRVTLDDMPTMDTGNGTIITNSSNSSNNDNNNG
jgi:ribosome biogenesis GTPase A